MVLLSSVGLMRRCTVPVVVVAVVVVVVVVVVVSDGDEGEKIDDNVRLILVGSLRIADSIDCGLLRSSLGSTEMILYFSLFLFLNHE